MAIWLKNGKIITDITGKVIECDECPCGSVECHDAVDAEVAAYLAEIDPDTQAHVWALYDAYEPDYTCAQWHYDSENEQWVLDSMASGKLAVALRHGNIVTDTTGGEAKLLTYAKVLFSASLGIYKTVGCECHVSDHECKHRKVDLSDYRVAGELDVWEPDESDSDSLSASDSQYLPEKACEVDPCKLLKLKMETAHYWHGGTLMGEGYYDWLLSPHDWSSDDNLDYEPFLMAIKWEVETSESESTSTSESVTTVYNVTYLNCGCTSILTHTLQEEETVIEYDGICTLEHPCKTMMLLHNQAEAEGWIWHGEGVLVHRAHVKYGGVDIFKDWYAWLEVHYWFGTYDEDSAIRIFKACAETPEKFIFINCDCIRIDKLKDNNDGPENGLDVCYKRFDGSQPVSETNPADYRIYLDMDGVCNCNEEFSCNDYGGGCEQPSPFRELLLTYPDVFGLLEVCYGNHAKFDWSKNPETKTEYDYERQQYVTYVVQSYGCNIFGNDYDPGTGERTFSIDYRALCVIARGVWQDGTEKKMVRAIYPQNSVAVTKNSMGHWQNLYHHVIPATSERWSGNHSYFDNAHIRGDYVIPFTRDMDIGTVQTRDGVVTSDSRGFNFTGCTYAWKQDGGGHDSVQINGCQPTESCTYESEWEAEDAAHCGSDIPSVCIDVDVNSGSNWDKSALLSPDFTVVDHPCSIRRVDIDNTWTNPDGEIEHEYETHWCVIPRWITYGAQCGECAWYLLNVNYVYTNKGLIVKGLNGFRESYTLIGVKHYPEYACDIDERNEHWDDEVIECPADLDMHSCLGWTDWGDESDSSSDSNSSSESTSVSEGV